MTRFMAAYQGLYIIYKEDKFCTMSIEKVQSAKETSI